MDSTLTDRNSKTKRIKDKRKEMHLKEEQDGSFSVDGLKVNIYIKKLIYAGFSISMSNQKKRLCFITIRESKTVLLNLH